MMMSPCLFGSDIDLYFLLTTKWLRFLYYRCCFLICMSLVVVFIIIVISMHRNCCCVLWFWSECTGKIMYHLYICWLSYGSIINHRQSAGKLLNLDDYHVQKNNFHITLPSQPDMRSHLQHCPLTSFTKVCLH